MLRKPFLHLQSVIHLSRVEYQRHPWLGYNLIWPPSRRPGAAPKVNHELKFAVGFFSSLRQRTIDHGPEVITD